MELEPDLHNDTRALLCALTATGRAVRLASLTGGLADLTAPWARHVDRSEDGLFPYLVAAGPAADGPVGFCLAEHAALSARLAELAAAQPTREWIREAELLISRMIQHLFVEARLLQPLLERMGCGDPANGTAHHPHGRGDS